MTAALLFRGGELLVNEAAISAILLASLQTATRGFSADRIFEGLIGGGVGLVVASLLLPPDPVAMVSRVAQNVVGKLGRTLEEAAERARRAATSSAPSRRCRPRAASTTTSTSSRRCCRSRATTARFSPSRRGDRDLLRRYELTMPQLDFAVRNTRVLARYVLRQVRAERAGSRGPARGACASSPTRSGSWACSTSSPSARRDLRPLALSAAQRRDRDLRPEPSPLLTQIVGQVRSVAVDLVRAADQLGEPERAGRGASRPRSCSPRLRRTTDPPGAR